ncbi:DUF4870 domain-containing protein [Streptosporangium sp. NPDC051022]|uniref:DUF4870 domain-containing protein n=1 Tax=Streptosporangium sp. NPDC051022 TaxID=3155752 RepID=UPI00342A0E11
MSDSSEDPRHEAAGGDHSGHPGGYTSPPQSGHPQPGHPQPGHTQPGYTQPGHPQPGYTQPGHPQPGYTQPGQAQGPGYYPPPPAQPYGPGAYGYQDPYAGAGAYGGYGYQGTYGPRPGTDDTTMAMLAHLLGLLTSFIGPLVLYLAKKDESPYVRSQAAEALNFQLTLMIAYMVSWVLAFVLIGFLLILVVWIGSLIFMIMAAIAAYRGENYRYPMNIRFVS